MFMFKFHADTWLHKRICINANPNHDTAFRKDVTYLLMGHGRLTFKCAAVPGSPEPLLSNDIKLEMQ